LPDAPATMVIIGITIAVYIAFNIMPDVNLITLVIKNNCGDKIHNVTWPRKLQ